MLSFPETDSSEMDAKAYILEQMGSTMKHSVDTAFPETAYTIEIFTNEEMLPDLIRISCEDEEKAKEIAIFIERNYGIKAETK